MIASFARSTALTVALCMSCRLSWAVEASLWSLYLVFGKIVLLWFVSGFPLCEHIHLSFSNTHAAWQQFALLIVNQPRKWNKPVSFDGSAWLICCGHLHVDCHSWMNVNDLILLFPVLIASFSLVHHFTAWCLCMQNDTTEPGIKLQVWLFYLENAFAKLTIRAQIHFAKLDSYSPLVIWRVGSANPEYFCND